MKVDTDAASFLDVRLTCCTSVSYDNRSMHGSMACAAAAAHLSARVKQPKLIQCPAICTTHACSATDMRACDIHFAIICDR